MSEETKEVKEKKAPIMLPDDVVDATGGAPRDLVIVGIPKIGKGTILGALTRERNALVLDLEKGGYEYISARKISTYAEELSNELDSFRKYIETRNALLANKGKYEFLIIDGLSDLDSLSVIGGTFTYMDSVIGKKFNRVGGLAGNPKIPYGHPDWKPVTTLPDGAGYQHTRNWFLDQIKIFTQIAPFRIYAAHIVDKYIKDDGKETVAGNEIALTGQLKRIFASRVTALGKLVVEGDKRYLNFDVQNDSIVAGSRSSALSGKILISEKKGDVIETYWESVYPKNDK
jgi:AAA domain